MSEWATVTEVIEILKKEVEKGNGDRAVVCNGEYFLAKACDVPTTEEKDGVSCVSLGGYY